MKKLALLTLALGAPPAAAQDIRGLEVCTAEKQMDRRTGCLQANTEFLQQAHAKHVRESNRKLAAADAEIAALKLHLARLDRELALLRGKPESGKK